MIRNSFAEPREVPAHILVNETLASFGYDPRILKPSSRRLVLTRCVICEGIRKKRFQSAQTQSRCLVCSNKLNAKNPQGIVRRSAKLKQHYANGGKHPLQGIGHTEEAKQKMREAKLARGPVIYTSEMRAAQAAVCRRVLHTPAIVEKTRNINRLRCGPLNPAFGRAPPHTRKTWYTRRDGTQICFRSTWEALFAAWLDAQGKDWQYESEIFPVTYALRGKVMQGTYRPDFRVGRQRYEVKGWWTAEGRAKFDAFRALYPQKRITIIDRVWLQRKGLLS